MWRTMRAGVGAKCCSNVRHVRCGRSPLLVCAQRAEADGVRIPEVTKGRAVARATRLQVGGIHHSQHAHRGEIYGISPPLHTRTRSVFANFIVS